MGGAREGVSSGITAATAEAEPPSISSKEYPRGSKKRKLSPERGPSTEQRKLPSQMRPEQPKPRDPAGREQEVIACNRQTVTGQTSSSKSTKAPRLSLDKRDVFPSTSPTRPDQSRSVFSRPDQLRLPQAR